MKNALFALLFLCAFSASARIVDMHSDIRIAKSGELTVTERITVEAGQNDPGLQRELPGSSRVVDVIRNGHPDSYTLEETRLRIGRGALAPGRHLYQITYRSLRRVGFLDGGYDELRWKLAGAERVTAEVILPATVPARDIRARAMGADYQSFVRDGRAAFRSKEAITIVVRFPKDVVAEPRLAQRARWFFDDHKGLLAVFLLLTLTAGMLLRFKTLSARA